MEGKSTDDSSVNGGSVIGISPDNTKRNFPIVKSFTIKK